MENLDKLVTELRKLPNETQWLEFKHNNYDPDMIGQDISALANSAALHEKSCAYMIWGVDDTTHEIVGTDHNLQTLKIGQQELESWLRNLLSPNADFEFYTVPMNGTNVGVLIIYRAANQTVMFKRVDYIRVGSYTKKLNEYPAMQAQLWDRIRNTKFEERYAKQDMKLAEALACWIIPCILTFSVPRSHRITMALRTICWKKAYWLSRIMGSMPFQTLVQSFWQSVYLNSRVFRARRSASCSITAITALTC